VGNGKIHDEALRHSREQAETRKHQGFLAGLEKELKAETDSHDGVTGLCRVTNRGAQTAPVQIGSGLPEMPHSWHEHPVCCADHLRVSREHCLVAFGPERPDDAPQVVHAIVHHGRS
jgi:hypothetical protein